MHSSSCSHFSRGVSLWTRSYRPGKEMHPPTRLLLSRSARSPVKITSGFCHWDVSARKPRHHYQPMSRQPHQVHKNFFWPIQPGCVDFNGADRVHSPFFPGSHSDQEQGTRAGLKSSPVSIPFVYRIFLPVTCSATGVILGHWGFLVCVFGVS